MEHLDIILEKLNLKQYEHIKPLKDLAQKAHLDVAHLLLIGILLSLILLIVEVGDNMICLCVGLLYPAFQSFKAIESTNKDDDKLWLTYWVVFSVLMTFDSIFKILLSFLPMYYLIKTVGLVALFHPSVQGAKILYDKVIGPNLRKYEGTFDQALSDAKKKINNIVKTD